MNIKITRISHAYLSFPNRLVVTVGIEPYNKFFKEMENLSFDVVIEKPEAELRVLKFEDIEKLATDRVMEILKTMMQ
jgi:hypothetical protein